jgi:hypothetical protein
MNRSIQNSMEVRFLKERRPVRRRLRARIVGIVTASALAVGLVAAPAAFGTADPASGGTFKLKLNNAFKNQLKNNNVSMKPKKWTINGGSLDPVTGDGTLTLKGKLTFKNKQNGKKAVFKSLQVTKTKFTGKSGGRKTIAKLTGGTIGRSGFDSSITGLKAKFKAAKRVNKKLDLDSLKNKKMGKATKTTVFSSLSVVGGSASLDIDTTAAPPQAAAKFGAKGVDASDPEAITATGTAQYNFPPIPAPVLSFPTILSGSTINQTGTFGQLNTGGGIRFEKTDSSGDNDAIACATAGHPASDQTPAGVPGVYVTLDNVRIDLEAKTASAEVTVPDPAAFPAGLPIGRLNVADLSGGTVTADPATRKISFSGLQSNLTATSPTLLGQVFGTEAEGCGPSAGGATDFSGGESVGTISGSVQAQ